MSASTIALNYLGFAQHLTSLSQVIVVIATLGQQIPDQSKVETFTIVSAIHSAFQVSHYMFHVISTSSPGQMSHTVGASHGIMWLLHLVPIIWAASVSGFTADATACFSSVWPCLHLGLSSLYLGLNTNGSAAGALAEKFCGCAGKAARCELPC